MKSWLLLLSLLALSFSAHASEPELQVTARLVPDKNIVVGSTVRLQIDVLVETWLTAAPDLPELKLSGASVIPSNGRAQNISRKKAGKTLFGASYSYLITPHQAGNFSIPALTIEASVGQASAPLSASTQPITFSAAQPPGFAADEVPLVASALDWQQSIHYSAQPLKVGDSITRELHLKAQDSLALNLPTVEAPAVDGLRLYKREPEVTDLEDGRGHKTGGQRIDRQVYVVEREGDFSLPPLKLKWWDSSANTLRETSIDAVEFKAAARAPLKTPFSVEQDLEQLGQSTRIHLSQYWLSLLLGAVLLTVVAYYARPLIWRGRRVYQAQRARIKQQWQASALFAWRQVGPQLKQPQPQLGAFYLWLQRRTQRKSLRQFMQLLPPSLAKRLSRFIEQRYAQQTANPQAVEDLLDALPNLRRAANKRTERAPKPALRPLNPH